MRLKKTIIIGLLLGGVLLFSKQTLLKPNTKTNTGIITSPIPNTVLKTARNDIKPALSVSKSIFVPYWALGQDDFSVIPYGKVYYFGITADEKGVVKDDPGYKELESHNCPNSQECILVLRLLDRGINEKILQNTTSQQKIIKEVLGLTNTHFFSGVALDLEISGLISDDTKGQINNFVQQLYTLTNKDYKTLSFIIYGDNYYRLRQGDMKFIGSHSDEVMIMAYDLSKNYGEPGPNFNFDQKEKYGYDFKQMISDFTSEVDVKKLTVIFGMYGYDWTLNEQGTPLKRGEAVTVNQINKLKTQMSNIKSESQKSKEKKIEYVDEKNQKHVIWYEDQESSDVKTKYLLDQGIEKVSFWAWGYF